MGYPKPEGYVGSGSDGYMLRQGSAGHLGWNPNITDEIPDRCNENICDGDYFSDYEDNE